MNAIVNAIVNAMTITIVVVIDEETENNRPVFTLEILPL